MSSSPLGLVHLCTGGRNPCYLEVKKLPVNAGDMRHEAGRVVCRRAWQPTPAFLPGESHGQRSLLGYSL